MRTFERNEVLFSQGDPANEMFVIESGRIAIATQAPDGRESMVAVLEEGGLFGELGLFDGAARSADARALVESRLVVLEYEAVRAALEANPEMLWVIVRLLARRLRATDEALADAVFLDVPGRTAKRLLELAGEADEFQLPMTQEELAAWSAPRGTGEQGAGDVLPPRVDRGAGAAAATSSSTASRSRTAPTL